MRDPSSDFTGEDGRACLTLSVWAEGMRSAFWAEATFESWGRWLEVSTPGFRPVHRPLNDIVGAKGDVGRGRTRTVVLARGPRSEGAFRDLAGDYGWGLRTGLAPLQIRADGRYRYETFSCFGSGIREYGFLKRDGQTISCKPIPRPGDESPPRVGSVYRVVRWGDSVFLRGRRSQDLRPIGRAALARCSRGPAATSPAPFAARTARTDCLGAGPNCRRATG